MKRAWLLLMVCLASCTSSDNGGHEAGTLTLSLVQGGPSDGAIVMIVSGGPVSGVDVEPGHGLWLAANTDGAGTHLLIVGAISPGAIATITVPDAAQAAAYVVTVTQVSDRGTFALLDPARYQVLVSR